MKDINQLDSKENILIKGARLHNLKNIDVAIPRNKFVVITVIERTNNGIVVHQFKQMQTIIS